MTREEAWKEFYTKGLKVLETEFKDCIKAGVPLEEIAKEGPGAFWLIALYENGQVPETFDPKGGAERGVKLMKGEIARKGFYSPKPLPEDWFEKLVEKTILEKKATP